MPLADERCLIADRFEHAGQRHCLLRQRLLAAAADGRINAKATRVTARENAAASRRTGWINVVASQINAAGNQLVESGRFDLRSVPADVVPAEIVGDDEENVGMVSGPGR